jgi:hypothetical protein
MEWLAFLVVVRPRAVACRGCLSARVRHQCRAASLPVPSIATTASRPLGHTVVNISSSTSPPARPAPASDQTENWASSFVRHSCEPAHRGATKTEQSTPSLAYAAPVRHVILFGLEPRRVSTLGRASTTRPWSLPPPLAHSRGHRRVSFADLRVLDRTSTWLTTITQGALASLFTVTHS